MPDDYIHARIDAELKAEIAEYVKNSGRYATLTDFLTIALINQLHHERETNNRSTVLDQVLEALKTNAEVRKEVGEELRKILAELEE